MSLAECTLQKQGVQRLEVVAANRSSVTQTISGTDADTATILLLHFVRKVFVPGGVTMTCSVLQPSAMTDAWAARQAHNKFAYLTQPLAVRQSVQCPFTAME